MTLREQKQASREATALKGNIAEQVEWRQKAMSHPIPFRTGVPHMYVIPLGTVFRQFAPVPKAGVRICSS